MVFVKSVDASGIVKDVEMLCNLFCEVIQWVGHENVVHVVTDNAANYVAVGPKPFKRCKCIAIGKRVLINQVMLLWRPIYNLVNKS
jgi:hypothetical protein